VIQRIERKREMLELYNTEPDNQVDGTPAHELIFLHSKESSIFSGDKNPNNTSVQDDEVSTRGRSRPTDTTRLMNMSLHGSMIANFLIKKAHEDIESHHDELS
jgi:hypothetical protein